MRAHRHHLMTLSTTALVAVLAAGCASDPASSSDREREATGTTSPIPVEDVTSVPDEACFNPEGGACLGELEPGSYHTTVFEPALRYRVGSGWVNAEDLPGNFWLYRNDDPQDGFIGGSYVGIYAGVRVPLGCREAWDQRVGDSPDEMLRWYVDHPGLAVTNRRDVTVGGLRGVSIDVALAPGYRRTCPWSEGSPVVPVIIGNGISSVHHVVIEQVKLRLVLLAWRDSNVTIEICSGLHQHAFDDYQELAAPVIRSLRFDG